MVIKSPKVQGSEKWGVMIFGEMRELSLIYIYVDICRLFAVHW